MTKKEINLIKSIDVDLNKATPMLRQFLEIKNQNQDVILLYRCGDFYETFFEDAITFSKALEVTLTSKDAGGLGKIPMAGIPAKALDNYLPKLLEKNYKISVCEQLENASDTTSTTIIKRGVVKIIGKFNAQSTKIHQVDEYQIALS